MISADGFVVTNNHVVGDNVREITIALPDKREIRGRVIGTDPATDIALLKIDVRNVPVLSAQLWAAEPGSSRRTSPISSRRPACLRGKLSSAGFDRGGECGTGTTNRPYSVAQLAAGRQCYPTANYKPENELGRSHAYPAVRSLRFPR